MTSEEIIQRYIDGLRQQADGFQRLLDEGQNLEPYICLCRGAEFPCELCHGSGVHRA